jgi:hypothetical protein
LKQMSPQLQNLSKIFTLVYHYIRNNFSFGNGG